MRLKRAVQAVGAWLGRAVARERGSRGTPARGSTPPPAGMHRLWPRQGRAETPVAPRARTHARTRGSPQSPCFLSHLVRRAKLIEGRDHDDSSLTARSRPRSPKGGWWRRRSTRPPPPPSGLYLALWSACLSTQRATSRPIFTPCSSAERKWIPWKTRASIVSLDTSRKCSVRAGRPVRVHERERRPSLPEVAAPRPPSTNPSRSCNPRNDPGYGGVANGRSPVGVAGRLRVAVVVAELDRGHRSPEAPVRLVLPAGDERVGSRECELREEPGLLSKVESFRQRVAAECTGVQLDRVRLEEVDERLLLGACAATRRAERLDLVVLLGVQRRSSARAGPCSGTACRSRRRRARPSPPTRTGRWAGRRAVVGRHSPVSVPTRERERNGR